MNTFLRLAALAVLVPGVTLADTKKDPEDIPKVVITGEAPREQTQSNFIGPRFPDLGDYRPDRPQGSRGIPADGQIAAAPSTGNSNTSCKDTGKESPVSEHPVVIATGEKLLPETDFQAAGDYGLGLHRKYRSMHAYGSLFGPQWLSNFDYPRLIVNGTSCDRQMVCVPKTVTVTQPDGARFV